TKSKRIEAVVQEVKSFFEENPSCSLRKASQPISPTKTMLASQQISPTKTT
ncbi:Hypothetical protein FKW44_005095, partial [Caligus rogercresseyi]